MKNMILKKQKAAVLKQNITMSKIITILILNIIIGILGNALKTDAKEIAETTAEVYKYYTSIQIEEGDNLWSLAELHMNPKYYTKNRFIKEVMQINRLKTDLIHAGEYLTIPYYSAELK